MTIKTTGPLTFTEIVAEFGDTTLPAHGLSEFYAGGANVPAGTVGFPNGVSTPIPTSGTIAYSNFYGASNFTGLKGSLRFRRSASAYLSRTPASAGNQKIWTYSGWIKRGAFSSDMSIFSARSDDNNRFNVKYLSSNVIQIENVVGGGPSTALTTIPIYRDPSSWYHIVIAVDTTQATSTNRIRLYINNIEVTSFSPATYPSQNENLWINGAFTHSIGRQEYSSPLAYFEGYMTDINFIDGHALTPTDFGKVDSHGMWIPKKKYAGVYGTNGFRLAFDKSGTPLDIGKDSSGNNNDWNVNGFSLAADYSLDVMRDVPSPVDETYSNYCVINPLSATTGVGTALKDGNLVTQGTSNKVFAGTIASRFGKFYYEYTVIGGGGAPSMGIVDLDRNALTHGNIGATPGFCATYLATGATSSNGGTGTGTTFGGFAPGSVFQVAWDADAGNVWFGKDGTWANSGDPATNANPLYSGFKGNITPAIQQFADGAFNFGQQPFKYTPPAGFKSLNTFNIKEGS